MYEPLTTKPQEVSDFSGGMTDNYLSCAPNQFQLADNFLVRADGKLLTRPGHIPSPTLATPPIVGNRLSTFIEHGSTGNTTIFAHNAASLMYADTSWHQLTGPSGNNAFPNGTSATRLSWGSWNDHLFLTTQDFALRPRKVYRDASLNWQVRTAGLPALASAPTVTAGAAGANTYLYYFIYYYTYTVASSGGANSVTYADYGPTKLVTLASAAAPNSNAVSISNIPVLANGTTENWDTANVQVYIYRTANAGTTAYFVGQVTNGTTIFSDNVSDATLLAANVTLYTSGGVLDNDPPPYAKYITVANEITWYANVLEGTNALNARVRQSVPNDGDSCPGSLFIDLEDEIVGMNTIGIYPIVFCRKHIYRLEGFLDETGRGDIEKKEISRAIGLESNLSIVATSQGLFFAGTGGWYFTDGYTIVKLSEGLNHTYAALANKPNIYGTFDSLNNRVVWAVQQNATNPDNDSCFVLDLKFGIKPDAVFTTMSGGDSFSPTAILFFNTKTMYMGDRRGYVFVLDDNTLHDAKVDLSLAATAWIPLSIIYDYRGPAFNFGTDAIRKWTDQVTIAAECVTNISLSVQTMKDNCGTWVPVKEVRYADYITWGDFGVTWNDPLQTYAWNYYPVVKARRRLPAPGFRCERRQVRITNSFTNIWRSDILGTATVDASLKHVTLDTYPTYSWPTDGLIDYYISFIGDNYTNNYLITAYTANVLTFADPFNTSISAAGSKWVIRGYRKNEVLNLLSYSIFYAIVTPTLPVYTGAQGGNA